MSPRADLSVALITKFHNQAETVNLGIYSSLLILNLSGHIAVTAYT